MIYKDAFLQRSQSLDSAANVTRVPRVIGIRNPEFKSEN
ncbi:hypothetical protein C8N25_1291 [Algoriphagus antarcticus]|uniref:Uncharacterized protein n=1 Tax=Algoriphagus antarcticus TaxID=238540 RepID=A0A3E0DEC9_9BACT|nr:hypothetical protein C8N25_1291 [Algoriphagus antarcticus]